MGQDDSEPEASRCPHIVFFFSDTGGGHRSAAQAIIEAMEANYPGQIKCAMVDIFRDYAPPLLARIPDIFLLSRINPAFKVVSSISVMAVGEPGYF